MRISKAEITNFRGLATKADTGEYRPIKVLNFDPNFNVIIGVNGIGKTSVLDALAIAFSRVVSRVTPATDNVRRLMPSDVRLESRSGTTISVDLDFDGLDLSYSVRGSASEDFHISRNINNLDLLGRSFDKEDSKSEVNAPIAILYTVNRSGYRLPRKIAEVPIGRDAAYQGALKDKIIDYRSTVLWVLKSQELARESPKDEYIFQTIQSAVRRFLPAFGELEAESNPPRLYIRKNGLRLGIEQLSDGERSFLSMVVDTARRLAIANPSSTDPLDEGKGIVLIDELELHLHPKWQRSSVEYLQRIFKNLQFITTTHSPFVIQTLRPGQLINLDPETYEEEYSEYSDQSIEDITEEVMGVEMPQKSERYKQMMEVAEQYFRILREEQASSPEEKEAIKQRLDELSIPFSDDPAYMALLKVERETYLGRD